MNDSIISSRTPEGFPSECPLCGAATELEFSDSPNDISYNAAERIETLGDLIRAILRRRREA